MDPSVIYIEGYGPLDLSGGPKTIPRSLCTYDGSPCGGSDAQVTLYFDGEGRLHIDGVPIGASMPTIRLKIAIRETVADNGSYNLKADIAKSGAAEQVPPSEKAGNTSTATIRTTRQGSSQLFKSVDKKVIEIGDTFTYEIRYFNSGNQNSKIPKLYLYDILPWNGDDAGSRFNGTYTVTNAEVYYYGADGIDKEPYEWNGWNKRPDGTIERGTVKNVDVRVWSDNKPQSGEEAPRRHPIGNWNKNPFEGMFSMTATESQAPQISGKDIQGFVENTRAVALTITNLPGQTGVKVRVTVRTSGNKGKDIYCNQAYVWVESEGADSAVLESHLVETRVVQRSIGGVVWDDRNRDGIRQTEEDRLSGVEVRLWHRQNAADGYRPYRYAAGTQADGAVATDAQGGYLFDELPPGDYIVTFGKAASEADGILDGFYGATKYRAASGTVPEGEDGTDTSDAKESGGADVQGDIAAGSRYLIVQNEKGSRLPQLSFVPAEIMTAALDERPNRDLGLIRTEKAAIRLKKIVNPADGDLANEPIDSSYKFMIRLREVTPDGSGYADQDGPVAEVSLGNGEVSGWLKLEFRSKDEVRYFRVEEIVPAEYDWIRLTGQQIDPGTGAPGEALAPVLDSSDLKERVYAVRAGETLQLTLTNKPEHKDYFHNTASVTNVGIGGSFTERFEGRVTGRTDEYREVPCDEPGGARTSSVPVEMRAVVDGMHTGAGDKENDPDDRLV